MITATTAQRRYIPECDQDLPANQQTVFILQPLTYDQLAQVQDTLVSGTPAPAEGGNRKQRRAAAKSSAKRSDTVTIRTGSAAVLAVRFGVAGWENLKDEAGNPVEPVFEEINGCRVLAGASLNALKSVMLELYAEIMGEATLDEDDQGNS